MMGGSKYPTLSSAKPVVHKLITRTLKEEDESDSSAVAEVKRKIKHDLQQRYQDDSVKKLLDVSAFIDPRYKELPFLDADDRKLIIDKVEDKLLALEEDMLVHLVDEVDSESAEEITECESEEILEVSEPPVKKKKEGPVQKLIGELFHQHSQPSHPLSSHSSKVAGIVQS